MSYEIIRGSADPYPLRASSFIELPTAFEGGETLNLSEAERAELVGFEKNLYEELKEIKGIKANTHEIYPAALTSGKGRIMMEIIYNGSGELKGWLESEADQAGLDIKDKDVLKKAYQAVFDDLFDNNIPQNGAKVIFTKLGDLIKEKTGKEVTPVRTITFDDKEETTDNVEKLFAELELKSIPLRWREMIHSYSDDWAREELKSDFMDNKGNVGEIENQKRICRLTDPEKNDERLKRLRELKDKITIQAKELGEQEDELSQGKVIVLDIYRKYINTQIVDDMLLRMGAGESGKEILSINSARMERYDRFIHGVGEAYDSRRNRSLLTDNIDRLVEEIDNGRVEEPRIDVEITGDDVVRITNWIIKEYGFPKWTAVKRKNDLGSIGVLVSESRVNIPKDPSRNLPALLAVLAHEVEGHVLSHQNWDSVKIPLKIMRFYSAGGRDEVLAEAAGKKIEKETRIAIDGFEDRPEVNYYRGMQLRINGGTFKDCLRLFFEIRLKNDGNTMEKVFDDEEEYDRTFNYAYDRAMRLFREHTPLGDTSGRLTTTDQLKYLEQESVVKALKEQKLDAILYVNGPDLYSVMDLIKLGVFELDKIQKPKMIVAEKIWPILKEGLEKGKKIKEILDEVLVGES